MEFRSLLHLLFINIEKAFANITGKYIWNISHRRSISEKLITIIRRAYDDAKCQVVHFIESLTKSKAGSARIAFFQR